MYRDDQEATFARLQALQRELGEAQAQSVQDKQRIAMLSGQLQATQQALANMGGSVMSPEYTMPGRSGTVLTLGILSLALCSLLGPIAWSMGNEELRRIDSGVTSPLGRGSVVAGRVCGIVSTSMLLFFGLMMLMMLASGH